MKDALFHHVLVGVDFSQSSRALVRQADQLAQQFGAKLVLVHAAFEPLQVAGPEGLPVGMPQPVDIQALTETVRDFYQCGPVQDVDVVVKIGVPADVIRQYAESIEKPLLIIGASERGALSRMFLGSQAEDIATTFIRDSEIPILVMKQTA